MSSLEWIIFFESIRKDHFISGSQPVMLRAILEEKPGNNRLTSWGYRVAYLKGLVIPQQKSTVSLDFLSTHHNALSLQGSGKSLRSRILFGLVWLRSTPFLRGVATTIPLRWQTRLKSWLRA